MQRHVVLQGRCVDIPSSQHSAHAEARLVEEFVRLLMRITSVEVTRTRRGCVRCTLSLAVEQWSTECGVRFPKEPVTCFAECAKFIEI